jgi:hypothetical protein
MALTRDFKETIQARVRRDPTFRKELLREAIETLLSGDMETGKTVLRDYINATVGFQRLAEATHHSSKSRNLFEIVEYLRQKEKVRFKVAAAGGV